MSAPFTTHLRDHIAEMVLARPPVNAFDSAGWFAIAAEIDRLNADPEVRVIVLRAEGKGFCAGVDIKELQAHPERIGAVNKGNFDTFAAIHRGRVPVIAAVHGFVLGGGIGISGAADIVLAAQDASFGVPEVDRGALGAGAHLQRMFSIQQVRRMYFTGESVTAAEALKLGAVSEVVPGEALAATARALAAKIAAKSPAMIALAKESLNGIEPDLERQYRWEQGFTAQAYQLADSQATRDAFVAGGALADFSEDDR